MLKAERYSKIKRRSRVKLVPQLPLQIRKSQLRESSPRESSQLRVRKKLIREEVLPQLLLPLSLQRTSKKLLSLRFPKSHSKLLSISAKGRLLKSIFY
jgi:hypothetical protein